MGSGRGKARRAQSVGNFAGSEVPLFQEKKWYEFMDNGGLAPVTLRQYYLPDGARENSNDYGIIVNELLTDAVAVGAVVLPDKYEVDDFLVKVVDVPGSMLCKVSLKSALGGEVYFSILPSLNLSRQLSEATVMETITEVVSCIDSLVALR